MRLLLLAAPALLLAGCSTVEGDGRRDPRDAGAKAPAVEFRSAFEGYRPFVEQEMQDWRRANEEVGAAGGHGAHK
jgi:predicted small secreted protein